MFYADPEPVWPDGDLIRLIQRGLREAAGLEDTETFTLGIYLVAAGMRALSFATDADYAAEVVEGALDHLRADRLDQITL